MNRSATVLIIKDGLILAVSRKNNHNDFGLPGGKCEENESFEAAAVRELREETGIEAFDLVQVFERKSDNNFVKTFIPKKYYGQLPTDEEQISRGEGIVRFLPKEDLIKGSFGNYNKALFKILGLFNVNG